MLTRRHVRIKVIQSVYSFFMSQNDELESEISFYKKSISNTFELYYYYFSFFSVIYKYSINQLKFLENAQLDVSVQVKNYTKILDNKILVFIVDQYKLKDPESEKRLNEWKSEIKYPKILLNQLFDSVFFKKYLLIDSPNLNQQRNLILNFFMEIIAPSKYLEDYLIDKKLTWQDDLPVVNTFIVRQIRSIKIKKGNNFIFPNIVKFKDDISFGEELLKICLLKNDEIKSELEGKTPNWDIDRIASVDLIILKVAIAEILNFESIPTKVTINEYIEISKDYSTPKSNIFINGVLDKLIKEFEITNRLNKVGRGLN